MAGSIKRSMSSINASPHLRLHDGARLVGAALGNHQPATLRGDVVLDDVADRARGVDDDRSRRVRHERRQPLDLAGASFLSASPSTYSIFGWSLVADARRTRTMPLVQ